MSTTDPMNSNDPDAIRAEIERTRSNLSTDVDTLAAKVDPRIAARKTTDKLKDRANSAKEAVMGSASSTKSSLMGSSSGTSSSGGGTTSAVSGKLSDATSSVQGGVSSLQGKASQAPSAAIQRTQGNPLAAGLVAFGLGWLFSSVAPATKVEERAAEQLADQAQQLKEPVTQHAKSLAQEVGDNLKGTAQEAAESV